MSSKKNLRIATRQSQMALWQANYVKQHIQAKYPELKITLIGLTTQGDKKHNIPLSDHSGKSLFVKELQHAVLDNQADLAVHCIKDMSVHPCHGLHLYAVCKREDPRDVLASNRHSRLSQLPMHACVGTSSPRRECLLKSMRPDLETKLLRGNVNTRLRKLDEGEYDAIILAAAGLKRLGETRRIGEYLEPHHFIPAIGQGALGIECRENDHQVRTLITHLDHPLTHRCIIAERAVNKILGGDCHTAIGAYAVIRNGQLHVHAMVGCLQTYKLLTSTISGDPDQARQLGWQLAEDLLAKGAEKLLKYKKEYSLCSNFQKNFPNH